jgi:hypothetical protein
MIVQEERRIVGVVKGRQKRIGEGKDNRRVQHGRSSFLHAVFYRLQVVCLFFLTDCNELLIFVDCDFTVKVLGIKAYIFFILKAIC